MQNTLFSLDDPKFSQWYFFKNFTELGSIYDAIPWFKLTQLLPTKKNPTGAPSYLKPAGLFGLMFLKHYTGMSDEKLIDAFNTNYAYQMFCGCVIDPLHPIRDKAFVSRVRKFLAFHCEMQKLQMVLMQAWKSELPHKNMLLMDATCYEVNIRFPTDVKLLWGACGWLWEQQIPLICKFHKIAIPRSKYKIQKIKQLSYQKQRKPSYKKSQKRRHSLLLLLKKGIDVYQNMLNIASDIIIKGTVYERFKTIKTLYHQQYYLFYGKNTSVKHRIVSLSQPHIRPILRGKENKPIEFGIKAHLMQVGGINIIEYHSFEAFNETTRLKNAVYKHNTIFGRCTHLAADGIYPTNRNRVYCTSKGIQTNFVRKGKRKPDKDTDRIKAILNKERSTRLEGSFGNQKEHYGLRKIKARTPETQILWMFFGVMTANAVTIAKRRRNQQEIKQAA
jgi:IS5 family transposase